MLQSLHIKNYAIIRDLKINFGDFLNIITGETGAGKSILMGALNLILGQRADTAVLFNKEEKCVVEARFTTKKSEGLSQFFTENDLDLFDDILIRREINLSGKSRAFINDTPVTLTQLKELGAYLVDLHQQFDNQDVGKESFQRSVLDALASNQQLLVKMSSAFSSLTALKKELSALEQSSLSANNEADYNQFLFDELEALNLKENELELLEEELKLLENAGQIKGQFAFAVDTLTAGEDPVIPKLKQVLNKLQSIAPYTPEAKELYGRLNSVIIETDDISNEIEAAADKVNMDENRLETVNERLSAGYKLLKKHGLKSTSELISLQKSLSEKLNLRLNVSEKIETLQKQIVEQTKAATGIATQITTARKAQVEPLQSNTNKLLAKIGMPNARLKVDISPEDMSATGADSIRFLFDANNNNRFENIEKVASGGELSRLMLSIKSLVAQQLELPTLIFDEIDTGISGEAARQVGNIMRGLSAKHQVIVISHQPQVAARAHKHFYVHKANAGSQVITSVKELNQEERVEAIAQMIGGSNPSQTVLTNAREMIFANE